jgi:hypothetical protein
MFHVVSNGIAGSGNECGNQTTAMPLNFVRAALCVRQDLKQEFGEHRVDRDLVKRDVTTSLANEKNGGPAANADRMFLLHFEFRARSPHRYRCIRIRVTPSTIGLVLMTIIDFVKLWGGALKSAL